MKAIQELLEEHDEIERNLSELEEVILEINDEGIVNFPNLLHTLKTLHSIWDKHEAKEEKIFPIFRKERIKIPVKTMIFEHGLLRTHNDKIKQALGSNHHLKEVLEKHGLDIIHLLRGHMRREEDILMTITENELTGEELTEIDQILLQADYSALP
jgi:hemerythrin-like domain-containing protein